MEELTNVTTENQEVEEVTSEANEGTGIGVVVLAGAVLVGIGFGAYMLGKKVIEKIKAKKAEDDKVIEADAEVK